MALEELRGRWSSAFSDPTGAAFAGVTSPDVVLEGSVFARAVIGRDDVWMTLRASSEIYQGLVFGAAGSAAGRAYLEWSARALGLDVAGVTVLIANGEGMVTQVAIHHRPLKAVLAFSAELGERLAGRIDPASFYMYQPGPRLS
jgi:hypothetical protein